MLEDEELTRLERVYAGYDADAKEQEKRDPANAGLAQIHVERARVLHELLAAEGLLPLADKRILDVGTGLGDELARLISAGADRERSLGMDALPRRVEQARARHPNVRFVPADGRHLPCSDGAFDLVLANVLFSSILDDDVATGVANEMRRAIAPGGAIVWWDNRYPTPGNPNVRGYGLREIERLFPEVLCMKGTTTLLPPIARKLGRMAPVLYGLLVRVPVLRGRYLALIRPPRWRSEEG